MKEIEEIERVGFFLSRNFEFLMLLKLKCTPIHIKGAQSLYWEVHLTLFVIRTLAEYICILVCESVERVWDFFFFSYRILCTLNASERFFLSYFLKRTHVFCDSTLISQECQTFDHSGMYANASGDGRTKTWNMQLHEFLGWRTAEIRTEKQNRWFICGEYSNANCRTVEDLKIVLGLSDSRSRTCISDHTKHKNSHMDSSQSCIQLSLLHLKMGSSTYFEKSIRNGTDGR